MNSGYVVQVLYFWFARAFRVRLLYRKASNCEVDGPCSLLQTWGLTNFYRGARTTRGRATTISFKHLCARTVKVSYVIYCFRGLLALVYIYGGASVLFFFRSRSFLLGFYCYRLLGPFLLVCCSIFPFPVTRIIRKGLLSLAILQSSPTFPN